MIPDSAIAEVRERADVLKVVGRFVNLRKAGTIYKGLCPFHDEKTPSFTVSPTRNTYHCFGCGVHGDSIRFLTDHGGRKFPEAVRELAQEFGIEIVEEDVSPAQREARQKARTLQQQLFEAQDKLTAYYSAQLFGPQGRQAQAYLQDRGITRDTAVAFRLGWASGNKRAFAEFLEQAELPASIMGRLGVLIEPDDGWTRGRPLDNGRLRFRERLMFPVVDIRGEVSGYSGRILDPHKKTAKYLNSPETPIFTKGQQLYGAFTARNEARRSGRLVLVEGNVDVIMLWQAGFKGTAAAMGTALTPQQVRLAKRLCDQIVCVMDGDAAGAKAAYASLVPFLEAGVQPRAVMLPTGADPDSYVREHGAEAFTALLDEARPLLDAFIEHVAGQHPADAPGRVAALRALAPALGKLDDGVAAQLYRDQVAARLEVSTGVVERTVAEAQRAERPKLPGPVPALPMAREPEFVPVPPPEYYGEPVYDAPPPLEFFDSVGLDAPPKRPSIRRRSRTGYAPRYVKQVFVFIMQYPHLAERLRGHPGYNCLTQPALADFVSRLCDEVASEGTPANVDRVLDELRENRELVAFLRSCETPRSLDDQELVDRSFENALHVLETQHYRAERNRNLRELRDAQKSSAEDATIHTLKAEKIRIEDALKRLEANSSDGAL